jgi:hypothetical protein
VGRERAVALVRGDVKARVAEVEVVDQVSGGQSCIVMHRRNIDRCTLYMETSHFSRRRKAVEATQVTHTWPSPEHARAQQVRAFLLGELDLA